MKALVIAEHNNHVLKEATKHVLTAATALCDTVNLLIIGSDCQKVAEEASRLPMINDILIADNPVYAHQLAENCARRLRSV